MDPKEKRKELYKDRVQNEVASAIKTTMIGAIASLESNLGLLWGMGSDKPLTPQEQHFLNIFNQIRKEILDRGNTNIKKTKQLIDGCEIDFVGYKVNLVAPHLLKDAKEGK